MRLRLSEIDKRLDVNLDKSIRSDGVSGVMKFGTNNDYPQIIERIIGGSITAKASADIYAKFLTGDGFENDSINKIVIGHDSKHKKITLRSLLSQVAYSEAYFNGAYIHCNFTLDQKIKSAQHILFKNMRFSKLDERGYTSKIGYYENWAKEKGHKFKKENIKWFDLFNTEEKVFISQIENAKGIENYKGQVYFHFLDNQFLYPLSPFDSVYIDADTENQIGLFKNNEVRNGFSNKTVFQFNEALDEDIKQEMEDGINDFMGSRGSKALIVETPTDENGNIIENKSMKTTDIKTNIDSKLFENWEKELANKIRKSVKALPAVLIDYEQGNLSSTSGESIIQATNFFNQMTKDDRNSLSEMFQEIFSRFDNEVLQKNTNWNIKPLKLYDPNNIQPATSD